MAWQFLLCSFMIGNMGKCRLFLIANVFFLSVFSLSGMGGTDKNLPSSEQDNKSDRASVFTFLSMEPGKVAAFPGAGNDADEILAAQLFTGPLDIDPKSGRIVPSLASEWEFSADRMSCRLRLGENFWSDGSAISASQIRDSWLSVLKTESTASFFLASHIRGGRDFRNELGSEDELGVRIPEEGLIEIEFEGPCSPEILAAPAFYAYPPELFSAGDALYGLPDTLRSSGAYKLEKVESGQISLRLRKEWATAGTGRSGGPEILQIMVPESPVRALELYRDGKADWLAPDAFPPSYTEEMEGRADYLEPSGFSSYFYLLNGNQSPLDEKALRNVLIGRIDRDLLLKELGGGPRLKAFSLIPPGFFSDRRVRSGLELQEPPSSLIPADAELLFDKPLILICPSDRGHVQAAESLIRQWEDIAGLQIELRLMEGPEFFRARKNGEYHLAPGGWAFSSPDPLSFLLQFLPGGLYGSSSGAGFEKAFLKLLAEKTAGVQLPEMIKDAEEELVSGESLILPLFFDSRPQLVRQSGWKGLESWSWYPLRFYRLYKK